MITANVIHRVFRILVGQATGTAFAIDVDGRQYLVTAKHVVTAIDAKSQIQIFANGGWRLLDVSLVGHAEGETDVSVLATEEELVTPALPLPAASEGIGYGQDVYFLGFPYDIVPKLLFGPGRFPLPLVKKALLSSLGPGAMLLDGHNNPGFSGGPVVFTLPGELRYRVAAVISGYQSVAQPILHQGQVTPLSYQYNTGIIVAYEIEHAVRLARANPIGRLLPGAA